LRLPQTEVGKFIDMQDSIYNYKVSELLTNRLEVEINDDVPTYYHKSKRYTRGKKARYSKKKSRYSKKRKVTRRRRGTTSRKRKSTSKKKK